MNCTLKEWSCVTLCNSTISYIQTDLAPDSPQSSALWGSLLCSSSPWWLCSSRCPLRSDALVSSWTPEPGRLQSRNQPESFPHAPGDRGNRKVPQHCKTHMKRTREICTQAKYTSMQRTCLTISFPNIYYTISADDRCHLYQAAKRQWGTWSNIIPYFHFGNEVK